MARATAAERDQRILDMAEAIACGLTSRRDLLRFATEQEWDVSERQVDTYIANATAVFKERKLESLDVQRRKRIKQLELLAKKNFIKGDLQEARHCIKALSDIEGIVKSRFRGEEETKDDGMAVVSRFDKNWKKVSGE